MINVSSRRTSDVSVGNGKIKFIAYLSILFA